jgi:hypothetical protein
MAIFQLTADGETFDCDPFGKVTQGGNQAGTWTTSNDNKIVITKTSGSAVPVEVGWQFDQNNHLLLSSGGSQIFDFHEVPGNRPVCATKNAVLLVRPDRSNSFLFQLRGEWDLDANHDLTITISGVTSTLDGFIDDPRSRFMFHFRNKTDLTEESILGFVGRWEQKTDENGLLTLDFVYTREDGSEDTFSLPKSAVINRVNNQLMYTYDKNNETYSIQIAGLLKISPDFEITYTIDRQVSGSGAEQVKSTSFTVEAVFTKPSLSGDLQLAIKKADGTAGVTTLTIAGNLTAIIGASKLQVGYSFSQIRSGNKIDTTFAFTGSLSIANNGQIQWTFEKNAQQLSVTISASDIKLGPARADARLNLTMQNGQVVGVNGLFGISF